MVPKTPSCYCMLLMQPSRISILSSLFHNCLHVQNYCHRATAQKKLMNYYYYIIIIRLELKDWYEHFVRVEDHQILQCKMTYKTRKSELLANEEGYGKKVAPETGGRI